jgi:hypothetical protein
MGEMLGVSKSSPDETQIRTTQTLSMPPDLQLRPPAGEVAEEDGQPASVAARTAASNPPADATGQAYDGADVAVADPAPQPAAPVRTFDPTADIYAKYGISKTKPDGTPKTEEELRNELRAAQLAAKRRENPNYGTIFNIGELFRDG